MQLRNLMSRGAIDNFQVAVAAHGDAATSAALDAIDELSQTYDGDRRWRIELLSLLDQADLARMGQNGVIASLQPGKLTAHRPIAKQQIGPERIIDLHRWRSIANQGAVLAFGSRTHGKAPRPFVVMAMAITRRSAANMAVGSWQTPETLTRQAALSAFTSGAAHALFAQGRLGRIAKGHRADFLLIDRDPLLASPDDLRETKVLQSWIGNRDKPARRMSVAFPFASA